MKKLLVLSDVLSLYFELLPRNTKFSLSFKKTERQAENVIKVINREPTNTIFIHFNTSAFQRLADFPTAKMICGVIRVLRGQKKIKK